MNYGSVRCKLNAEKYRTKSIISFFELFGIFLKKNQFIISLNKTLLNLIKYTRLYQMSITNLFEYKVLDCYV